jgi:hypothetical protein
VTAVCVFVGAVLIVSGCLALLCLRREPDPYPPEAAEAPDPVDSQHDEYQRASWFTDAGVPVVDGGHPKDCGGKCCFEIRLTELVAAFDWHAAEHEMRSKR